ncbi:MAG: S8/S53 family peptidase [Flavobacterium sp.]|nr:S8/S53 family peptidase [Flavobacterium sp.]
MVCLLYTVSCKEESIIVSAEKYSTVSKLDNDWVLIGEKGGEKQVKRNELNVLKGKYKVEEMVEAIKKATGISKLDIVKMCDECDNKIFLLRGADIGLWKFKFDPGGGDACQETGKQCAVQPQSSQNQGSLTLNQGTLFSLNSTTNMDVYSTDPNTIKVAIVDSGIDITDEYIRQNINNFYVTNNNVINGIDVVANQSDTYKLQDQIPCSTINGNEICDGEKHGTKVAKLIIDHLTNKKSVKILPIKISSTCPGSLYDALCGVLTAQKYQANVINISWGYEATPEIFNLTQKIFKSLRASKINVVVSAGNEDRNLREYPKYPACFSRDLTNIITVTAIKGSPTYGYEAIENWSDDYVQVGVQTYSDSVYQIPVIPLNGEIRSQRGKGLCFGTSYAAAIFTSQLCNSGFAKTSNPRSSLSNLQTTPVDVDLPNRVMISY